MKKTQKDTAPRTVNKTPIPTRRPELGDPIPICRWRPKSFLPTLDRSSFPPSFANGLVGRLATWELVRRAPSHHRREESRIVGVEVGQPVPLKGDDTYDRFGVERAREVGAFDTKRTPRSLKKNTRRAIRIALSLRRHEQGPKTQEMEKLKSLETLKPFPDKSVKTQHLICSASKTRTLCEACGLRLIPFPSSDLLAMAAMGLLHHSRSVRQHVSFHEVTQWVITTSGKEYQGESLSHVWLKHVETIFLQETLARSVCGSAKNARGQFLSTLLSLEFESYVDIMATE